MDKSNYEQNNLAQKVKEFKSNIKSRNLNMVKQNSDIINEATGESNGL